MCSLGSFGNPEPVDAHQLAYVLTRQRPDRRIPLQKDLTNLNSRNGSVRSPGSAPQDQSKQFSI